MLSSDSVPAISVQAHLTWRRFGVLPLVSALCDRSNTFVVRGYFAVFTLCMQSGFLFLKQNFPPDILGRSEQVLCTKITKLAVNLK